MQILEISVVSEIKNVLFEGRLVTSLITKTGDRLGDNLDLLLKARTPFHRTLQHLRHSKNGLRNEAAGKNEAGL